MVDVWLPPSELDAISDAVAGSRDRRCRLFRPTVTVSSGGAPDSGFEPAGELSCRVQPASGGSEGIVAGRIASEVDYTVAFHRRATVATDQRIEVDGLRLEVIAATRVAELVAGCRSVG